MWKPNVPTVTTGMVEDGAYMLEESEFIISFISNVLRLLSLVVMVKQ